uniref:Ferrous iron transport protein B n=1 Tax=Thermofilum pendens TaxID=2269 RepID=A0A7C4B9C2_THEPE
MTRIAHEHAGTPLQSGVHEKGGGKRVRVALAGAPNVGKSTLFNMLVGARRFVGNWPGKTIDRYEGELEHHGIVLRLVDLPGTYSLSALSEEEEIARDFIVREKPDVVVVVVNAVSLETTMYLVLQVLELYDRVVVAVNKMDAAARRGLHISLDRMSRALGVPVVGISALRGEGLHELIESILAVASGAVRTQRLKLNYGGLANYAALLERDLEKCAALKDYPRDWAALRLLEGDSKLEKVLAEACPELLEKVERTRRRAEEELDAEPALLAASTRYTFISELLRSCVAYSGVVGKSASELLDRIYLSRLLGLPAALATLMSVLVVAFAINTGFPFVQILEALGYDDLAELVEGYTLSGLVNTALSGLADIATSVLFARGASPLLVSLIAEGVLGGVGAILAFLPLIFLVFIFFGFLEDTGVMARIAVASHALMRKVRLSGKALLPLTLGFGCNVPAVMGTKILPSDKEKLVSSFVAPLVPCQARLVVLLAFATALFSGAAAAFAALVLAYLIALFAAGLLALLLNRVISPKEEVPELLVELPPYHVPSFRVIWWYAVDNAVHFLRKAGVIIFLLSLTTWVLLRLGPSGYVENIESSFAYIVGSALAPLLTPVGLGRWEVALALMTGFVAKESVLATLIIATGSTSAAEAISRLALSPSQALALMVFVTLYVPCLATLATFHAQFRRPKLTLLLATMSLVLAYAVSLVTYIVAQVIPVV